MPRLALPAALACLLALGCGAGDDPRGPDPEAQARIAAEMRAAAPDSSRVPADGASGWVSDEGFQAGKWGMTREQLQAVTGRLRSEDGATLLDEAEVAGQDAVIGYQFTADDRLARGVVVFVERHSAKASYVDDYRRVEALLDEKYGPPEMDHERWKDDLFRDDPKEWGMAVAAGHLVLGTSRASGETEIGHMLSGDNYQIRHSLIYESVLYADALDAEAERDHLDDL